MLIVPRRFSQLSASPKLETSAGPKVLSEYFSYAAVVVLGEPGAGKTTSFQQAAGEETGAVFVTVRDFLALSADRWLGKVLYIDGLDEQRAKSEDGTAVLDRVRSRLDQMNRPKFRLSCRAADWYGSSDANALQPVSADEHIVLLSLDPLSDDDVRAIAADRIGASTSFLEDAERRGLQDLLYNPQTLGMIVDVVAEGTWPSTRTELFERACDLLVKEMNPDHSRVSTLSVATNRLIAAAGCMCAVVLAAGAEGVALNVTAATSDFLPFTEFPEDSRLLGIVARRRLFRSAGAERISPTHRTIAEFLAARYLTDRIRSGLPLGRVLALLTGCDQGTLADLRGIFAWLAALCSEYADLLITHDPLGVVLYGDVASLATTTKTRLLEVLSALSVVNPWFRSEDLEARPFAPFATPEMEPVLRRYLEDSSQSPVLLSCVCDAARFGERLPLLAKPLLAIARDPTQLSFLRVSALKAFAHATDAVRECTELLEDIRSGRVLDAEYRLRGCLLRMLYPKAIGPERVFEYVFPQHPTVVGEYTTFVEYELLAHTPSDAMPHLLDGATKCKVLIGGRHWDRLVEHLLTEAIPQHASTADDARLYEWLGIGLDRHAHREISKETIDRVRAWLVKHKTELCRVIRYWLSITPPDKLRLEMFTLNRRLCGAEGDVSMATWYLDAAANERVSEIAAFLFEQAVWQRLGANAAGTCPHETGPVRT